MDLKIKVNNVDITAYVLLKSINIESLITKQIDTCSFIAEDSSDTISIAVDHEVIITNDAETIRYFAGYVADVDMEEVGMTLVFKVDCQDYTVLPEMVLANKTYDNKTDAYILNDLFTTYLSEVNATTHVTAGKTITRIVFDHVTLRQCIERLAEISGFDWYVDYSKNLHYFPIEQHLAPFDLSDAPDDATTYGYGRLKYKKEKGPIINKVLVLGGKYWSDNVDLVFPMRDGQTELLLPFGLHKPDDHDHVQVYKNTNIEGTPAWTEQTVGTDYIHSLTDYDCLFNYMEKVIRFAAAPGNFYDMIKVHCRYDVPVIVQARSEASYVRYSRWFEGKVVDNKIDNRTWALDVAKGVLAKEAFEKERGTLRCWTDGLFSGMRIKITNSLRSIDDYYLIHKVTTRPLGGNVAQYTIGFGEYNPDLIDLLVKLKRYEEGFRERRVDEMPVELLSQEESLALTEADELTDVGAVPTYIFLPADLQVDTGALVSLAHEELDLAEDTDRWEQAKGRYAWCPG